MVNLNHLLILVGREGTAALVAGAEDLGLIKPSLLRKIRLVVGREPVIAHAARQF